MLLQKPVEVVSHEGALSLAARLPQEELEHLLLQLLLSLFLLQLQVLRPSVREQARVVVPVVSQVAVVPILLLPFSFVVQKSVAPLLAALHLSHVVTTSSCGMTTPPAVSDFSRPGPYHGAQQSLVATLCAVAASASRSTPSVRYYRMAYAVCWSYCSSGSSLFNRFLLQELRSPCGRVTRSISL